MDARQFIGGRKSQYDSDYKGLKSAIALQIGQHIHPNIHKSFEPTYYDEIQKNEHIKIFIIVAEAIYNISYNCIIHEWKLIIDIVK